MNQWVYLSKIEQSFDALKELVLRNQFLHSCPRDLALFLRERTPSDMHMLKELADVYATSRSAVGMEAGPPTSPRTQVPPKQASDLQQSENSPRTQREPVRCFLCSQVGHMARSCPTGKTLQSSSDRPMNQVHVAGHACVAITEAKHMCTDEAYLKCGCYLSIVDMPRLVKTKLLC